MRIPGSKNIRRHPRRWLLAGFTVGLVLAAGHRARAPLDAERLVQRAEAELRAGDAASALRTFTLVTRRDPTDARGYDGIARALQARAGFPSSEAEAESLLAAEESVLVRARRARWPIDSRAIALRNYGFACFRLGEFERALPALVELQASGAGSLETDLALAVTARSCEQTALAERVRRACRTRYGPLEPVWKLGIALQQGCDPWTTSAFLGLRNLTPWRPPLNAADACSAPRSAEDDLEAGRVEAAETRWRALLSSPAASLGHLGLGRAALRRAAADEALREFALAETDTALPRETLHYWRAQAHLGLGRFAAARAELVQAAASNPLALRDDLLRGAVETAARDTAAAAAAYQRVLEVDRRQPEALYRLGTLWVDAGREVEGRTLLQRYLEVQPTGAYAREVRRVLEGG